MEEDPPTIEQNDGAARLAAMKVFVPGKSKSTMSGFDSAEKHLEDFLNTYDLKGCMSSALVTEKLFDQFSKYMSEAKRVFRGVLGNYAVGSIMMYLSGVYNILKKRYPNNPIFHKVLVYNERLRTSIPQWYTELRGNLESQLTKVVQLQGKKLQENKSESIGPIMGKRIGEELLKENTKESIAYSTVNTNGLLNGGR